MTRAELVAAVVSFGADHLATLDVTRFVNEAVREFDAEELWPWRIVEQTGAAPLVVTTLGPIDSVRDDERRVLFPRRHSELIEARVNLADGGPARFYYVQSGVVNTWPVSSGPITVRHYDQGGWVTGDETGASDGDVPRADVRWHDAILILAQLRAVTMDRDWEGATRLWERYQARLEQAKQAELRDNNDEPDVVRMSEVF